jgi:SAM-dependent methyltransferase
MSYEAAKTKKLMGETLLQYLTGNGIDIGCGDCPILPDVERFDQPQGDANRITDYIKKTYDFVFSAHCLEHLYDPKKAIHEWYQLVKPGGHLVVIVPDEDLYEQGHYPSLFNPDHKWTFTISKRRSWSPKSINVLELAQSLQGQIQLLELQDQGIDRNMISHRPSPWTMKLNPYILKLKGRFKGKYSFPFLSRLLEKIASIFIVVVDQTALQDDCLAQICLIVRKPQ